MGKKIKIGLNGMGRIGRTILREYINRLHVDPENCDLEIVAVNNPGNIETYCHLIKFDSVHRIFPYQIHTQGSDLYVDNQKIHFFTEKDPAQINWSEYNIDLVIDATGIFKDKEGLSKHLKGSVKKVIMCAPGKKLDGTFVMGINHQSFDPNKHHIISNASCTTNCLAPVAKVLNQNFGIESGLMTTVHSYTNDQAILDQSHEDLRRARAAAMSIIPTSTGAAKALGEVLPELAGKLDGFAVRVPTPNVSMVDLTVMLQKAATTDQINQAMHQAASEELKGILAYTKLPLVSVDFLGTTHSSIFDATLTNVINGKMAKVVAWYDNEVGFSNRVIDLAQYVGKKSWQ